MGLVQKKCTCPSVPIVTLPSKLTFLFLNETSNSQSLLLPSHLLNRNRKFSAGKHQVLLNRREAPADNTWYYNLAQSDTGNWPEAGVSAINGGSRNPQVWEKTHVKRRSWMRLQEETRSQRIHPSAN